MKMSPHAYFHPNNSNDKPFKCYFDDGTRELMHWADLNFGYFEEFPDTPETRAQIMWTNTVSYYLRNTIVTMLCIDSEAYFG